MNHRKSLKSTPKFFLKPLRLESRKLGGPHFDFDEITLRNYKFKTAPRLDRKNGQITLEFLISVTTLFYLLFELHRWATSGQKTLENFLWKSL
jgi:hypothetical protein